jgi:MscS family membrane protein
MQDSVERPKTTPQMIPRRWLRKRRKMTVDLTLTIWFNHVDINSQLLVAERLMHRPPDIPKPDFQEECTMKSRLNQFVENLLSSPQPYVKEGLYGMLILVIAGLVWAVFNRVVTRFEKRYRDHPVLGKKGELFPVIRKGGHYSILILLGASALRLIHAPWAEKVFFAGLILLLTSLAQSIVNRIIPFLEAKLASKTDTQVDDVILDLSKKFSGVIIYTTGIILTLDLLGLNIMPFIAGAGVAGIAIGFAAKDTLSNLIAGVLLIIDRPFEVGDRIEVWSAPANSATWGDVLDIGLRATKIRTTDNIVIVIPNNEIMRRDIINYTTITEEIRVRIPIGIAYDADVRKAKDLIVAVTLELDWVLRDPAPKVVVKSFGDSAVNLEARVWISDPRKRMDTISTISDRVKERFTQDGIEIPYPKRDIYIKTGQAAE